MMASAVLIIVGAALTLTAQELLSDDAVAGDGSGATVRISALKSDDGAVRVALQEQGRDGAWQGRQHPRLNTVGASAQTGIWLNSSPLHVSGGEAAVATVDESKPLYCVVAHGHAMDSFWAQVRGFLYQSAGHLGAHVRFHSSPDGSEQAAAIDACSDDGAAAIAATLAAPEAVTDALLAAKANGARIVTFNSGAAHAQAAGSELHIALDDLKMGQLIGELLNDEGLTGTVGCLIHEQRNVGLDERCDGLAETFAGGEVRRIQLPTADDPEAVANAIGDILLATDDDQMDIVVSLNAATGVAVLRTVNAIEDRYGPVLDDKRLFSVGYSSQSAALRQARYRAGKAGLEVGKVNDAAEQQGYLIVSALIYVGNFPLPAALIDQPAIMLISPWYLSATTAGVVSPAERIAIGQAYEAVLIEGARAQAEANAE